jgi:hypothetical protein
MRCAQMHRHASAFAACYVESDSPSAFRPCPGRETNSSLKQGDRMLYTIAVILLIAWLLGIVGTYTIGAFVHVLLVVAIVLFLVGLVSGRRALA